MSTLLFAGPSLAGAEPRVLDGFTLLPPAAQGDVYRALSLHPRSIGIVDGYFEGVPSVWHKEILFAISHGVRVYGSASIGALRAAELEAFGMIGVGEVFASYRDCDLDADDEVALLHGPADVGFLPLTEPLVNVRATCRAAEAAGILSEELAGALIGSARSMFYKERTWGRIVAGATGSAEDLAAFEAWLPEGAVDQKRIDALAMLERMRADAGEEHTRPAPAVFEPTFLWEQALESWARVPSPSTQSRGQQERVLNELRLDPDRYREIKARARQWIDNLADAEREGVSASRQERAALLRRRRAALGLMGGAEFQQWLVSQGLERAEFDRLVNEEAVCEASAAREDEALHDQMIALLKLDGAFARLAERASSRAEGLTNARKVGSLPPPALLEWFFRTRLGREPPEDIDRHVRDLGLPSRDALYGLLANEYLYLVAKDEGGGS